MAFYFIALYSLHQRSRKVKNTPFLRDVKGIKFLHVGRFRVPCRLCNVRTGLRKKRKTGNSGFGGGGVVLLFLFLLYWHASLYCT